MTKLIYSYCKGEAGSTQRGHDGSRNVNKTTDARLGSHHHQAVRTIELQYISMLSGYKDISNNYRDPKNNAEIVCRVV